MSSPPVCPVTPRLYVLLRLTHLVAPPPPINKVAHEVAGDLSRVGLGRYRVVTCEEEVRLARILLARSLTRLRGAELPECFARIRNTILAWQQQSDFPVTAKSCSALATAHAVSQSPSQTSASAIPKWVLEEFSNCLLIDEDLLNEGKGLHVLGFERLALENCPPLLRYVIRDGLLEQSRELGMRAALRSLRNVPHASVDEDLPPTTVKVYCENTDDLYLLASRAYSDVPNGELGLGGRALLMSLCLERNAKRVGEDVELPNASALGLRYRRRSGELTDQVLGLEIRVKSVVGRS